jgi:hypothetical protein
MLGDLLADLAEQAAAALQIPCVTVLRSHLSHSNRHEQQESERTLAGHAPAEMGEHEALHLRERALREMLMLGLTAGVSNAGLQLLMAQRPCSAWQADQICTGQPVTS